MKATERPVVLLETSRGTTWGSCLTIMPNLASAYHHAGFPRVVSLDFGRHSSQADILVCAKKIFELNPTHLVFLDHQKQPYDLLVALNFVFGRKRWPALVFHLYGDFTLYTPEWARSEKFLKRKDVTFVCASPRQQKLVSAFVRNAKALTATCPFPISEKEFHFVSGLREEERQKRGIAEDEFVMLYTGRLSLQKNVLKMIWDLQRRAQALNRPWRLLLAGSFDDLGAPFFGLNLPFDSYRKGYERLIETLSEESRQRVEYIGALGKRELLRIYHAADLFVSFSTHHDEDYGMSPIEALCCGTRALITDWGGFGGFAIDQESVSLVPVKLSGRGALIESQSLEIAPFTSTETEAQRLERSQLFLSRFGIQAASRILRGLLDQPKATTFSSFTPLLKQHAQRLKQSRVERGRPLFALSPHIDSTYKTTYTNYLTDSKDRS